MRKLLFAISINNTDNTGLVDVSKNPPELFCLCDKDKADEILGFLKPTIHPEPYGSVRDGVFYPNLNFQHPDGKAGDSRIVYVKPF